MTVTLVKSGLASLENGELLIVLDDVNTQIGYLVGIAEKVNAHNVNLMTKIGKGLVYTCIPEDKAKLLQLPLMNPFMPYDESKPFTVSVDLITTTTGISAFERADTIRAFTSDTLQPQDFRTPGHVFPLVSKEQGLLQRVGIAEAAVDLTRMVSSAPVAYICEMLSSTGAIATPEEVAQVAYEHDIPILKMSEIIEMKREEIICSFAGQVIRGNQIGRKIGFPTANLSIDPGAVDLDYGVYGVTVSLDEQKYYGVINIGIKPTVNKQDQRVHFEVHIFSFDGNIYGKHMEVDVRFFVREERSFSTVEQLIMQIEKDVETVKQRFRLTD